jgi:hypothetical protein
MEERRKKFLLRTKYDFDAETNDSEAYLCRSLNTELKKRLEGREARGITNI